jgi:four helix bundle suffix protein
MNRRQNQTHTANRTDGAGQSPSSRQSPPERVLPPHGGYENLFSFREFIDSRPGPVVANIVISLIHQTNYLLDRQIRRLEQDFLREGGLRERMSRARLAARARNQTKTPVD